MQAFKVALILLTSAMISFTLANKTINSTSFHANTVPTIDVDGKCFQKIYPVRSNIQAAHICSTNKQCLAFSNVDPLNKSAWIQVPCDVTGSVTGQTFNGDSNMTLWTTHNVTPLCKQQGMVYHPDTDSCDCTNKMVGQYCDRIPSGCEELFRYGHKNRGEYLTLNGNLTCWFFETTVQTIVVKTQGKYESNYTFEEQEKGWRTNFANYFIGLKRMYNVFRDSSNDTQLILQLTFAITQNRKTFWRHWYYWDFSMSDEAHGYRYSYDRATSQISGVPKLDEIGDCLGSAKGNEFSTWDYDKDNLPNTNCALERGAGWWFADCSTGDQVCNPFGLLSYAIPSPDDKKLMAVPGLNVSAFSATDKLIINMVIVEKWRNP